MAKKAGGAKAASKSNAKVASATTSRTGQVGAAEKKVTPVEDANDKAATASRNQPNNEPATARTGDGTASTKAGAKEAPGREGHAVGVPRKSMEAKFGPKDPDIAETARRQAAVGGI